jgi:3'(2'), 5'-bisphosphate nucleotidase
MRALKAYMSRNFQRVSTCSKGKGGRAVLGVVLAPALPQGPALYLGVAGQGAWRAAWAPLAPGDAWGCAPAFPPSQGAPWQPIRARAAPPAGITVVGSRSHGDDQAMQTFLASRSGSPPVTDRRGIGSSLKFCLLAEGQADLYPRLGRTMEWDTAAGHAVLQAAGGRVLTLQAEPLSYGKPGFENPHFVAEGIA